jgi:hypothetical protein
LYQVVLPLKPANALPLLAAELEGVQQLREAVRAAVSMDLISLGCVIATQQPIRTVTGSTRM